MPVSKDSMFFSTRVKIERAKQHVRELAEELAEYFNTKPFRIVVEKDTESDNHLWTLRMKNEVPGHLSEIIGEAANKLRTSLDLLASDMVSMAGGDAKNVCFPFGEDAGSLKKAIKQSNLDRAGDDIVDIVKSLKPYRGGNELLRALHDLDLTGKRKPLVPSVHYAGIKDYRKTRAGDPILKINNAHCGPIHDGMVIASMPPVSNARVGKTFQPLLKITFDEDPLLRNKDIAEALNGLIFLTEEIIRIFVAHFEPKGE